MKRVILGLLALVLAGCNLTPMDQTAPQAVQPVNLGSGEDEYCLAVLVDMSGSFSHQMADEGQAWTFLQAIITRYFNSQVGSANRIVVAQLSGSKSKALLFDGTPLELRRKFPTAEAFRRFLQEKSDGGGSLIYDGTRTALEYIQSDPRVVSGKAKAGLFVLSDMLDTSPDAKESGARLNHQLSVLGLRGGIVGLYFLDQERVVSWRQRLQALGIKNFCVMGDIAGNPTLPNFD